MIALLSLALADDPAFDLDVRGSVGPAGPTFVDGQMDLMGRAGLGATGWITRRVGLGFRLDAGSYGLLAPDGGNGFFFGEASARVGDHLGLSAGVGTPIVWVEYVCIRDASGESSCDGPWEYHKPIGVLAASWDLSVGHLHFAPGVRAEVGGSRWGVGADVAVGLRLRRPGPVLP